MKTVSFFSNIDGVWMKNVFTFSLSLNYLILTQGYVFHWFTTLSSLCCRRVFCFNGKTCSIEGFLQKRGFPFSRIKKRALRTFLPCPKIYLHTMSSCVCIFLRKRNIYKGSPDYELFLAVTNFHSMIWAVSNGFFCNKRSDEQFSHVITIISRIQRNTKVW